MQVHLFEAFIVLAEELNYRRAAERLSMSQPGLTQQIYRLEHHLGVELFTRDRQGSRLTASGEELLPLARAAVDAVAQICDVARRPPIGSRPVRRRLRIGILGDGLGTLTWPLLTAFSRERPDVDIVLTPMGFLEAFNAIDDGRADAILATGPLTASERQDVLTVDVETIAALFTLNHPSAEQEAADLEQVARNLTYDTPAGSDSAFRHFWTLEDIRAAAPRQISRLRQPPDGPVLDDLVKRVGDIGGVGLWPSSIPISPQSGCIVRPLDRTLHAPRQLAAHAADDNAQAMVRIAHHLTRATEVPTPTR